MKRNQLIKSVRKEILTCRMNVKYHANVADRYAWYDWAARATTAVVASVTAAGAGYASNAPSNDWLTAVTVMTALVAVVSGLTVALPPGDKVSVHLRLREQWLNLRADLEDFESRLREMDDVKHAPEHVLRENARLKERLGGIRKAEPAKPNKKLLQNAYDEVRKEVRPA